MPASPTATPEHIKDVNTRYHDARRRGVRRQVGHRLRRGRPAPGAPEAGQGAGRAEGPHLRRRAGDRLGHRLLLAQPRPARGDRAADRDRHLAGDAEAAGGDRRRARARGRHHGRHRGRGAALRGRELRPRLRPRRPPPHPRPRQGLRRIPPRPAAGRDDRLRRRALPLRRHAWRRCRSAPAWRWRRSGAARSAPSERAVAEAEQSDGHSLEGEVDVHAFAPADLRRLLRDAGFEQRHVGGEELLSNAWGWGLRTVESSAEPESISFGWRRFAFNSYIALQKVDTRVLEPYLPAELFYNLLVSAASRPSGRRSTGGLVPGRRRQSPPIRGATSPPARASRRQASVAARTSLDQRRTNLGSAPPRPLSAPRRSQHRRSTWDGSSSPPIAIASRGVRPS